MAIAHRLSFALLLISLLGAPPQAPAARHTAVLQPGLRDSLHGPARQRVDLLPDVQATTASTVTLTMTVYLPVIHKFFPWPITRVSVASNGTEGNVASFEAALSADGRLVAFSSDASTLVADDTNNATDIFVHDRASGQTTRVSVASDGTQSNWHSFSPVLSADGRLVAFSSDASTLVAGDTNNATDIFVHDRTSGQTTRVSVASDGMQSNWHSFSPVLSADGHYVAFASAASNLVPGDTNGCGDFRGCMDIFVHDRATGETTRVSVASDGTERYGHSYGPALSADGQVVAFHSGASTLVADDTAQCRYVRYFFINCTDIFVHDRATGETTRVSVASDGTEGDSHSFSPALSADGQLVAFQSYASNLVVGDTNRCDDPYPRSCADIFVHDRASGETTRASVASDGTQSNADSYGPALSADGQVVAFHSGASTLVAGDANGRSDVFVHDRASGQTTRISVAFDGTLSNGDSQGPALSANGQVVAFQSDASNLVADDTNGVGDIFVVTLPAVTLRRCGRHGRSAGMVAPSGQVTWPCNWIAE